MSKDSNNSGVQFAPLTEMCIDQDDIKNIKDFFTHFGIPVPDKLNSAMTQLENALQEDIHINELIKLQNSVRVQLCTTICETDVPLFKDPLFDEVIHNAKNIAFISNFDDQLETLVSAPKEVLDAAE